MKKSRENDPLSELYTSFDEEMKRIDEENERFLRELDEAYKKDFAEFDEAIKKELLFDLDALKAWSREELEPIETDG